MKSNTLFKVKREVKEVERGGLDLFSFIMTWSIKFPFDRIWREKHNIPFGSKVHREAYFFDILMEIAQDIAFQNLSYQKNMYSPGQGKYIKERKPKKMSQKEIEQSFEDLDINKIEYDKDGNILI